MVTVIIPTYKRAQYIERAIHSVLRQTYKDYEIIVVDDNNPNTEDRKQLENIMEKYIAIPNIIYIQHEKNKNGAAARNTGINIAKGEYITFLDDDDYFFKDRLQIMVDLLENNKEYNGAYSSALIKRGKKFYNLIHAKEKGEFEKETLRANSMIGTGSNMFFRAQALKDINGFDEEFLRHQDYEVLVRFFENGNKMINVDKILVVKDNSNAINLPNLEKAIKYREMYLQRFEKNIKKYEDYKSIYLKNYIDLLEMTLQNKNKEEFNKIYNKLKEYDEDKKVKKYVNKIKIKYFIKKINMLSKIKFIMKCHKISKEISEEEMNEIVKIERFK